MKKIASILLLSFILNYTYGQNDQLYKLKMKHIDNENSIDFKSFSGKKILVVNTSCINRNSSQIHELDMLQKKYPNKLAVVIIPMAGINGEPGSNAVVAEYLKHFTNLHYICLKSSHQGKDISPIYSWVAKQGSIAANIDFNQPFQKILLNEKGQLQQVYSAEIRPLSKTIIDQINN